MAKFFTRAGRCSYFSLGGQRCVLQKDHNGGRHMFMSHERPFGRIHIAEVPDEPTFEPIKLDTPPLSWRAWKVGWDLGLDSLALKSVAAAVVWEGATLVHNERLSGPVMPDSRHIGIHSYKKLSTLQEQYGLQNGPNHSFVDDHVIRVVGIVENRGRVVEHELGFRATHVTIKELWFIYGYAIEVPVKTIDLLRERYQCKITPLRSDKVIGWAKYYDDKEEIRWEK